MRFLSSAPHRCGPLWRQRSGSRSSWLREVATRLERAISRALPVQAVASGLGFVTGHLHSSLVRRGDRMRRRELIGLFGISAAGWPWIAASQPRRERTARIGYLAPAKIPHLLDAFKNGLRDLGYIEGRNITIEYRFANGEPDDRLAAELAQLAPDIIVTLGTGATIAAKRTAGVIPIVVATAGDLVRNGIVQSLARPGGNVTGTTLYGPELSQKRLEMLKETVPGVKLVSVLGNSSNVY